MSEKYLIKKETLASLVNKIKDISGTTENLAFGKASSTVRDMNEKIESQSGPISLIKKVVDELPEVSGEYNLQEKTVMPFVDGTEITFDEGYDGLGTVTVLGDEDLKPENIKLGVNIFGVEGEYERDYSIEDALITKNIVGPYVNDRVTNIASKAFMNYSSLTSVNFPNCIKINGAAFYGCTALMSVNIPNCTRINNYAYVFPGGTGTYGAFGYCSSLTSVDFPNCTGIGDYTFFNCTALTNVSFPKCTNIGYCAFSSCSSLANASFPKCTSIGWGVFNGCSSLTNVSFPKCTSIGYCAFSSCSSLANASFPKCTSIGSSAFAKCYNLSIIILNNPSVCTLSNSNAFTRTPYAGYSKYYSGTPYIYVPSSLVDAYKSATNWTYFSNYFSAIENANLISEEV